MKPRQSGQREQCGEEEQPVREGTAGGFKDDGTWWTPAQLQRAHSPECLEGEFCELVRRDGVLRSSLLTSYFRNRPKRSLICMMYPAPGACYGYCDNKAVGLTTPLFCKGER